jgi:hypothetical protein
MEDPTMKHRNQNRVDLLGDTGSRWRAVIKALALPATRMHNYRNLHRTMFYDAVCELDCKDDE